MDIFLRCSGQTVPRVGFSEPGGCWRVCPCRQPPDATLQQQRPTKRPRVSIDHLRGSEDFPDFQAHASETRRQLFTPYSSDRVDPPLDCRHQFRPAGRTAYPAGSVGVQPVEAALARDVYAPAGTYTVPRRGFPAVARARLIARTDASLCHADSSLPVTRTTEFWRPATAPAVFDTAAPAAGFQARAAGCYPSSQSSADTCFTSVGDDCHDQQASSSRIGDSEGQKESGVENRAGFRRRRSWRESDIASAVNQWAAAFNLSEKECSLAACHIWRQVEERALHQTAYKASEVLAICLWLGIKLFEQRATKPTATMFKRVTGMPSLQMAAIEMDVMDWVQWAPLRGFL